VKALKAKATEKACGMKGNRAQRTKRTIQTSDGLLGTAKLPQNWAKSKGKGKQLVRRNRQRKSRQRKLPANAKLMKARIWNRLPPYWAI